VGAAGAGPLVAVVMGSDSDWPVMSAAADTLAEFGVAYEADVVSAHRMPHEMISYGSEAAGRGLRVIIAGAGGAAHLPGMLASVTPLPVIGVPVPLAHLDGLDSLLSIVSMPAGVPVATVAVGGARNAGLLAVRILAASDPALRDAMAAFQRRLREEVLAKGAALRQRAAGGRRAPGPPGSGRLAGLPLPGPGRAVPVPAVTPAADTLWLAWLGSGWRGRGPAGVAPLWLAWPRSGRRAPARP
jgi:5-(carboxyamino)imidazole ribonucleotide mutase